MIAVITDVHYRMAVALIRDLAEAGVKVVACDTADHREPVGFASRHIWRSRLLPEADPVQGLWDLCWEVTQKYKEAPVLLPVGARTLAAVSAERERFSAVCKLAVATPEQLALLNDKAAVHALAEELGIPVPRQLRRKEGETERDFYARAPYPCVAKPLCGEQHGLHAEQRYRIARTPEELEAACRHFLDLTGELPVVEEYLPGGGLGCSVLADKGTVLAALCHRRIREYPVTGGPSSCCQAISAPELEAYARKLMASTGFSGVAMVEFKEDAAGKPRILEVNPRVWGTYPLTRASGSNFGHLWFCLAAGLPIPAYQPPQPVKMAFYPSDLAAALGYARRKELKKALAVFRDLLDPQVKNGLHEKEDPAPWRAYVRSLLERGRKE